ncbi:uncharacterized protein LOC117243967 [Parus major]|uniref:uncharacterized protein LOC117243967 n=1 Tax=Parus major TaxID=9157 RepID=UPI001443C4FD|nr:uncharacterized protein LOC117243967 [Parus major]
MGKATKSLICSQQGKGRSWAPSRVTGGLPPGPGRGGSGKPDEPLTSGSVRAAEPSWGCDSNTAARPQRSGKKPADTRVEDPTAHGSTAGGDTGPGSRSEATPVDSPGDLGTARDTWGQPGTPVDSPGHPQPAPSLTRHFSNPPAADVERAPRNSRLVSRELGHRPRPFPRAARLRAGWEKGGAGNAPGLGFRVQNSGNRRQLGWKKLPRSSSPTYDRTSPGQRDHGTECYVQSFLNTSSLSCCPVAGYLGEEPDSQMATRSFQGAVESDKVPPESPFLEAEPPPLPQPVPVGFVLHPLFRPHR